MSDAAAVPETTSGRAKRHRNHIMNHALNFSNKVIFVTGAGTGIGRATAVTFARAGARVVAVGRTDSSLQETTRQIEAIGGEALAIRCDVTHTDEIKAALDQTISRFGRLDFAFNNAGAEQPSTAASDISEDEWDRVLDVNLRAVFVCMKHQIPLLRKQGGGVIVNTSSGAGVKGFPGQAAYCAAKHGLIGLTRAAALDYAKDNIRVNAVCPGIIDTPRMERFTGGTPEGRAGAIAQEPVGRPGNSEEIANTVLWLCSDMSGFVVGASIVVDGGQTV